jgi:hypothetical protein
MLRDWSAEEGTVWNYPAQNLVGCSSALPACHRFCDFVKVLTSFAEGLRYSAIVKRAFTYQGRSLAVPRFLPICSLSGTWA